MLKHLPQRKEGQRGFTLLFSTLVASLILVIALAIANISLQQFLLSSSGRESQSAFFNADSGIDCAQYYDRKSPGGFEFPSKNNNNVGFPSRGAITCGNNLVSEAPVITRSSIDVNATTTAKYKINMTSCNTANPSFEIEVNKKIDDGNSDIVYTLIRARGYNSCDTSNPRRVERGLLIRY